MKYIFAQTAEYRTKSTPCLADMDNLTDVIRRNTGWDYLCLQTGTGYSLRPTFRNMPYRNSFVPAIDIVISHEDEQTILQMRGLPVMPVRIFMAFWFGLLSIMEIVVLTVAVLSGLESILPVFAPIIMCAFGYFLCKTATSINFESVLRAIKVGLAYNPRAGA